MKSKTSYFKVSTALIKEDFRKFWAIPVLVFLFYFLTGIFYIIANYSEMTQESGSYLASYVETLLAGKNPCWLVLMAAVPILSTVLVFSYLHNSGKVMTAHSQPFTRFTLMNSHALSALLFSILPIIAIGIILLVIAQPVYYPESYYSDSREIVNLFSRTAIWRWMWDYCIASAFVLAISIIAGMATGTPGHHVVAAIGFNCIVQIIGGLLLLYFDIYLFGFSMPDGYMDAIYKMSPVSGLTIGHFGVISSIKYILAILVFYLFAGFLYVKRKLERATDGVVFKAFDAAITLIFGFLGMTCLGITFYQVFNSTAITIFGYIVGAVLGIIICRMVIMKTINVFDKKFFIITGAYLIAALVFILCLVCDVTGYETRIPDDAEAVNVQFGSVSLLSNQNYMGNNVTLSDSEGVSDVQALQKLIIENKDVCVDDDMYEEDYNGTYETYAELNITYYSDAKLENKTVCRSYNVPMYLLASSEEMKELLESDSLKNAMLLQLPESGKASVVQLTNSSNVEETYFNPTGSAYVTDQTQMDAIVEALKKDIKDISAEDLITDGDRISCGEIQVTFEMTESQKEQLKLTGYATLGGSDDFEKKNTITTNFIISSVYKNTIACLESLGYGDYAEINSDRWDFAILESMDITDEEEQTDQFDSIPESTATRKVITDKETIKKLAEQSAGSYVYGKLGDFDSTDDGVYQLYLYSYSSDGAGGGYYYVDFSNGWVRAID